MTRHGSSDSSSSTCPCYLRVLELTKTHQVTRTSNKRKADPQIKKMCQVNLSFSYGLCLVETPLASLTNSRIILSRAETVQQRILVCNDADNQFNHVMRDGLSLGDFEVINKRMWQLITAMTTEPASHLIRSFERIGLGMRT